MCSFAIAFCGLGCVLFMLFFMALVLLFSCYSYGLGLAIFLMLFFMVWSCFSFVALGGLGCVLLALFFVALVMFFSHCSSWP